jgi:hypothetical protein
VKKRPLGRKRVQKPAPAVSAPGKKDQTGERGLIPVPTSYTTRTAGFTVVLVYLCTAYRLIVSKYRHYGK